MCRLDHARQWAIRLVKEAQLHEEACFITLTFNNEELLARDIPWSLDKRDFQLFMKRLRHKTKNRIIFYHCGEYGENNYRPHYHAILFGFNFPDKKPLAGKKDLYTSELCSELWPYGFNAIGDVTFQSCSYVARYVMKKRKGLHQECNKSGIDLPCIGPCSNCNALLPEYSTMSRGGEFAKGIAYNWIKKYYHQVYPNDFLVINGIKSKPPRYFDNFLKEHEPALYKAVKEKRIKDFNDPPIDHYNDPRRKRLETIERKKLLDFENQLRAL
jgi:hypothetical protein